MLFTRFGYDMYEIPGYSLLESSARPFFGMIACVAMGIFQFASPVTESGKKKGDLSVQ